MSAPDEPPRLLNWAGRPELTTRFALRDLTPGEGYAASLAVDAAGDPVVVERDANPLLSAARAAVLC